MPQKRYIYVTKSIYEHYAAKWDANDNMISPPPHRPYGLYCWTSAFRKHDWYARILLEADLTDEVMRKTDIIHANITSADWDLCVRIRKRINSLGLKGKIKFIGNVDYSVENWHTTFHDWGAIDTALRSLDYIFSVEPFQATVLSRILGRNVPVIEHTGDILDFKSYRVPNNRRVDRIVVPFHPYLSQFEETYAAIKGIELPVSLVGYIPRTAKVENDVGQISEVEIPIQPFFDEVVNRIEYIHFMRFLAESKIVFDPYRLHSLGRVGVECAALGVPFVSTDHVQSAKKLFPKVTTRVDDIEGMRDILDKLINDQRFYNEVVNFAYDKVEEFNFDSQFAKMMKLVNGGYDAEYK